MLRRQGRTRANLASGFDGYPMMHRRACHAVARGGMDSLRSPFGRTSSVCRRWIPRFARHPFGALSASSRQPGSKHVRDVTSRRARPVPGTGRFIAPQVQRQRRLTGAKKTPQKAALLVRASDYGSALFAARVVKFLLGRHPFNHLHGIVTVRVQFERDPVVADGRLVGTLGHGGLGEGVPCVGR